MSAYATLMISENPDPFDIEQDTSIVSGNRCIPLCWSALFVGDDLHISWKEDEYWAVLMTTTAQAIHRFAGRIPLLTRILPDFKETFNTWTQMLDMIKQPVIKADISILIDNGYISQTVESLKRRDNLKTLYGGREETVRMALSYFEKSSDSSWEALYDITALEIYIQKKNGQFVWVSNWQNAFFGVYGADWLPWMKK